jgi:hypothetical protein
MKKEKNGKFIYTFKSLNNNLSFYFSAEDIKSRFYDITVFPAPLISGFTITITPPAYTELAPNVINNIGNITVPEGSTVKWEIKTENIDSIKFIFNDTISAFAGKQNNVYFLIRRFLKNTNSLSNCFQKCKIWNLPAVSCSRTK